MFWTLQKIYFSSTCEYKRGMLTTISRMVKSWRSELNGPKIGFPFVACIQEHHFPKHKIVGMTESILRSPAGRPHEVWSDVLYSRQTPPQNEVHDSKIFWVSKKYLFLFPEGLFWPSIRIYLLWCAYEISKRFSLWQNL